MIKTVEKRDGRVELYNPKKIKRAVLKAYAEIDELYEEKVLRAIKLWLPNKEQVTVEEVQDSIEHILLVYNPKVAKAYILYREQHRRLRELREVFDISMIDGYMDGSDWKVNENANISFSLQGLNMYITGRVASQYWLGKLYSSDIAKAHEDGDFHIHDLSFLSPYCVGWDLQDLLTVGFKGPSDKTTSKPAKHFDSALSHITNFIYTLTQEAAGAQALSSIDTYLAPFIRKDNLSEKQVYQEVQKFIFNMSVSTKTGGQVPFSNITLDLQVPKNMEEVGVIIGGEMQNSVYGDYQEEMDMFNNTLSKVFYEGDARGSPHTFPIPTYNITPEFEKSENLELWKVVSKYGLPYFANFLSSDMDVSTTRSMCPLAKTEKVLFKSHRYKTPELVEVGKLHGKEYEIYAGHKFVKGKFQSHGRKQILAVQLVNGHEIRISADHENLACRKTGEVETISASKLKPCHHYLPYDLTPFEGDGGTYEMGFLVGAFAGDGSFNGERCVTFSLNKNQKMDTAKKLIEITKTFGALFTIDENTGTELMFLRIHSNAVMGLCKDFVTNKSIEKHYKPQLFVMSKEFRQGVLDGHLATDGTLWKDVIRKIYTSSVKMVESLNLLAATLGTFTTIHEHKNATRKGAWSNNSNYCVVFQQLKRNNYGDYWFKKDGFVWVKIKSIEQQGFSTTYCFEIENDEPLFTLAKTGVLTHNCRLHLDTKELKHRGGGLFGSNPLTGSSGVVTLNMPRIGVMASDDDQFIERVCELMQLAKKSLVTKRKVLERLTENKLYPYSMFYLRGVKERTGQYWDNHFSTIGLVGMNEALIQFMGCTIGDKEGIKFTSKVLDEMNKKLIEFQEETGTLWNLEATPAEGSSYSLALKDKKKFGKMLAPFGSYSNSTQLPVNYTDDIFEALILQDELQTKYTGGTSMHMYLGERCPDPEGLRNATLKIFKNFKLPYISWVPQYSICEKCGRVPGVSGKCPKCGNRAVAYTRVVGYFRPVDSFHPGKKEEFERREYYEL